jgi:hypothetical protein
VVTNTPDAVRKGEAVSQVAKYAIVVGRVPECAERKKKPDIDLSAFYVTPSVTPEADLLTCGTTSGSLTAQRNAGGVGHGSNDAG